MNKLKTILHSKKTYLFFLIFLCCWTSYFLIFRQSKYKDTETVIEGEIISIYEDGDFLEMVLHGKEKVITYYTFQTEEEKKNFSYQIGDEVSLKGTFQPFREPTHFHDFNSAHYYKGEGIFRSFQVDEISLKKRENSQFAFWENQIEKILQKKEHTKGYLYAFLLGNTRYLKNDIKTIYSNLGIRHLFAISGMHLSFFLLILDRKKKRSNFLFLFLFAYLKLLHFKVSAFFAIVSCFLKEQNRKYHLELSPFQVFFFTTFLLLFQNPYALLQSAFAYSFLIRLSFVFLFQKGKKITSFSLSLFLFFITIPLNLYDSSYLNFATPFYNLLFIPLVTFIVFPLTFLSLMHPIFEQIYLFVIEIMEHLAILCSKLPFGFYFIKPSFLLMILYFLLLLGIVFYRKLLLLFVLCLFLHYQYPVWFQSDYLWMIDVGQGDCFLLHSKDKNILIDTGGERKFSKEAWQERENQKTLTEKTLVPLFHSFGISHLDAVFLSHGDFDHAGEMLSLIENIPIRKVFFNNNSLNSLEQEILQKLEEKKIPSFKGKKNSIYTFQNIRMLSLQDGKEEENESSLAFYVQVGSYKLLFLGDSTKENEEQLVKEYHLEDIDVLKVSHHGSKTSSSASFLDVVRPKIALISAGRGNLYHHPNEEVLKRLSSYSSIYVTKEVGDVRITFKKRITISTGIS